MKIAEVAALTVVFGVVAGFAGMAYKLGHKPVVEAKPAPCVAAANEMCPTAEWLKDYDEWKALNDEIEGSQKKKRDLRKGWADRLNEGMPQGYYFDVTARKFVKRDLAPPIAPPHK